ncbi:MAG: DUF523 domain-containing protein [Halothermotrichaceae bacterium]
MILVSACLMGKNCRYDGDNCLHNKLARLLAGKDIKLICPETAGGLDVPRVPAEIVNGDGFDVLEGKAHIDNKEGQDVTRYFLRGCNQIYKEINNKHIEFAVLKSKSPSCGVNQIYSGRFDGKLQSGRGVWAAYLIKKGIPVYTEQDIEKIENKLD